MLQKFVTLWQKPYYLWILAVYPILFLYSQNLGLIIDKEVLFILIISLLITSVLFLIINQILKNSHKTALILGVCTFFFFFSGHLYTLVFMPNSLELWTAIIFIVMIIIILAIHMWGTPTLFKTITPTFNLILIVLLITPLIMIINYYIFTSPIIIDTGNNINLEPPIRPAKANDSKTKPDIYLIIPDAYPSDIWLQEGMDYDNSAFTQELIDRGFVVPTHAQSNYGSTLLSIPSILNMKYIDKNESSPKIEDRDYLRLLIADSLISRKLIELGYTYILFLSGYLIPSPTADINRDFTPLGPIDITVDENWLSTNILDGYGSIAESQGDLGHFYKRSFITLFVDTTLLSVISTELEELYIDKAVPYDMFSAYRFLDTLQEVKSISAMPEATFTIIHLLNPHRPVVFQENGEIIKVSTPNAEQFFGELKYINSEFLNTIDYILENSANPPVIVLQADHGSMYGTGKHPETKRKIFFDAYAAYYLPPSYSIDIPNEYTLINSFALILNELFDTQYEIKENRLFELLGTTRQPFDQDDVTESFQRSR